MKIGNHSGDENKVAEAFATGSIPKVVIKNSIPALIAMIMVMVYNMADIFFISLTHDDLQVAAVSLASPVFLIFMSLGTLFGVGGTSVISRALGNGNKDLAKKACSFCMWASVAVGLAFMAILWIFREGIATILGASENTMDYTLSYLTITIGCGVFSMVSNCFSNILRTEGEAMKSMTGNIIGNLVNIVLDPIMILAFGWGIAGAAVATVIGNVVAALYYVAYFLRGKSCLSISPRFFSMKDGIVTGVISIGISASLANLLSSLSTIVINGQLSGYAGGDMMVAAYGVTSKVVMVVTLMGIGIGAGVQSFLGYCYGARNKKRLLGGIKYATIFGLAICVLFALIFEIFAEPVARIFLTDATAIKCAAEFTRILMSTGWLIGVFTIFLMSLQAMGAATLALVSTLLRQGVILISMVFLLQAIIGMNGLIWAQPVADVSSVIIIVIMLVRRIRRTDFT